MGPVMVLAGSHPAFPVFRGIDLATVDKVTNLDRFISGGKLDDLDDDSVIVSIELASSVGSPFATGHR